MTRFLSESLDAPEPYFRNGLKHLERVNGNPCNDIRLSTAVLQETQKKLKQLGLDPRDTTAEELYQVLNERIKSDDIALRRTLRTRAATFVSAEAKVVDGMVHVLSGQEMAKQCFALKTSKFKAIIKNIPPKKAMKQLGYRSIASFLKHESAASILASATLTESQSWHKQLLDLYSDLVPSDFETRAVVFFQPRTEKWINLAHRAVVDNKHNLLCFRELGSIVLLPLPEEVPDGAVTVSLSLALHELNEIRATSTFLKLCQVRADFGSLVKNIVEAEPRLSSKQLDQDVPWHLIQRYYSRLSGELKSDLFEPHIHADDMSWQSVESVLMAIEPKLAFWHGNAHLGLLHNHQAVSLNIVDVALNVCNRLPFEQRITQAFKRSLWHELLLKYLNHDTVEQTVFGHLQPQLAAETALI